MKPFEIKSHYQRPLIGSRILDPLKNDVISKTLLIKIISKEISAFCWKYISRHYSVNIIKIH